MNDLTFKFDALGFDLTGLDSLIYLGGGGFPPPSPDPSCKEHCVNCAASCETCGAGCSSGPSK